MSECPHCRLETRLFIPPAATPPKQKRRKTAFFAAIGLILLAIGVTLYFKGTGIERKPPAQELGQNLQEVQGAMSWNLGEVLPTRFQAKTNDHTFGITCDFDPPADMEIEATMCYLILTEDRRIAAICVSAEENKKFNKDNLKKVLTEKYGLRASLDLFAGLRNYYFGAKNRQAILTASSNNSLINLEYRDEQLYKFAEKQTESRKAATDHKVQKTLKGNL